MAEQVVLTLTREQAAAVEDACELAARLRMGQFNIITEQLIGLMNRDDVYRDRDWANELLKTVAKMIFGTNQYGWPDIPEKSFECLRNIAVWTTLRHARAWHDHPEGGIGVSWDKPLGYGEKMPKAEWRVKDDG